MVNLMEKFISNKFSGTVVIELICAKCTRITFFLEICVASTYAINSRR